MGEEARQLREWLDADMIEKLPPGHYKALPSVIPCDRECDHGPCVQARIDIFWSTP